MIYDISMNIHEKMQVYKNLDFKIPKLITIANHKNDNYHETDIKMNLHTGTHVDFPLHMVKDGKISDNYKLKQLVTSAKVFDLSHLKDHIDKKDIQSLDIQADDFILFKTKNSHSQSFLEDFIYVNESAARYLVEKNIKGVGIDGLGIERNQKNHPTHKQLLSNDILIIEGLRLKDIKDGIYKLICLPLKINKVEASPARAILIK
ncbi:MAG: cyclase family protein [Candidatus Izimaplasma sp.]|nr:cyclase family protein [Candidatus Izimaplasma bacterium]